MRTGVLILMLVSALAFCSCASENGGGAVSVMPEIPAMKGEEPHPFLTDIVSEYADRVDYLDFETSSYERKYGPQFVMIHFTSDVVENRTDPYSYEGLRRPFETNEVGTNYIILRDGETVCWLPEERCAWHAGVGTWNDDPKYENKMNHHSIGIELAAIGSRRDMSMYMTASAYNKLPASFKGFTEEQYDSLALLVYDICKRNEIPLTREHIIGHEEYSPRKTDPGELFDWDKLMSKLEGMK